MNAFPGLEKFLNWLLNHSIQAGLLVGLVLLVQLIFHGRLTNRWRFALWWLVLIRLMLPLAPTTGWSVFNYVNLGVKIEAPRYALPVASDSAATETATAAALTSDSILPASVPAEQPQPPPQSSTTAPIAVTPPPTHQAGFWNRVLGIPGGSVEPNELVVPGMAAFWALGVIALVGCVFVQVSGFRRKLSGSQSAPDSLLELLRDCQREFGVARKIELLETDAVKSPALFGVFRLKLLLPKGLAAQFTPVELRYIFLHELAHVKRGDLWLNWLVTALQIVHWFNPLIWLGFARLRADRELACDEMALLRAGDKVGTSYGQTVIKLLEGISRPAAIPGLIGILEDKKQMRRRIEMIANFRRPGRWSVLAVLLLGIVAAATWTDAQPTKPSEPSAAKIPATNSIPDLPIEEDAAASNRPDLVGEVHAKGGAPLPASVFIATAAPKTGTSTFCPSCYADCIKHSKADAEGNFKIESLNPTLTFQVLAVAKGFKPKFVSQVDPAKGPVKIELDPIEASEATPERTLRGRLVNPKDEPVQGAVVEMVGIETKDGGGSYGSLPGIDPLAVTDENGEFLITSKKPFDMMIVKVVARTLAPKTFTKLASGSSMHKLAMTEGATITGRVMFNGKPLSGVSVGLSGADRSAGTYLGHFEVGTGTNGTFEFMNVPPDADFIIYGLMNTMKPFGAIADQPIHSGKDDKTTNAGDLVVKPAHRLAGRVILADAQTVPPDTRLLLSREKAWDSMQLTLDNDGGFDSGGIPSETISLSVRVKGYHVSSQNKSIDQLNFRVIGRMDRDITNLVYLLEKGPDPQPNYNIGPGYEWPGNRPLRGAEGGMDHSSEWKISGRVIDATTKEPISEFQATPGQTDQFERTGWDTLRSRTGTNGDYLVYVSKRFTDPMVKVEAAGYLPASAMIPSRDAANVDFVLTKGSGPSGFVMEPDGQPAVDATVVQLGGDMNQAALSSSGELMAYRNRKLTTKTATDGKFTFTPEWGTKSVAAASSNGFALVSLEFLATNSTIVLERFGNITGTLTRTSGPGTNEDLDLSFGDVAPGRSPLSLNNHTVTDSEGRFAFKNVPAGNLRISYRESLQRPNQNSWTTHPLKDVTLKPGQNLTVNIETKDRSAPDQNLSFQPPEAKRIPGMEIRGVVFSPDGKAATDAEVALQVESKYLAIAKGAFASSGARDEGLLVNVGPDGSFTLPMYEKAQSVIALNESGYAQVSIEELKTAPQIRLQKWGRIEGTLKIGHHPGAGEKVVLSRPTPQWSRVQVRQPNSTNSTVEFTNSSNQALQPPIYDYNAFQVKADEQGHFSFTFVPPGSQTVARVIPIGGGSSMQSPLGTVEVKPGETVQTSFGGTGRAVSGRLKFADGKIPDLKAGNATIHTPTFTILEKMRQLKTDDERKAFRESKAFADAMSNRRSYPVIVQPDGSFQADDVVPGNYELSWQPRFDPRNTEKPIFSLTVSEQEIVVPEAKDKDDDSSVDLGSVGMKSVSIPVPAAPEAKGTNVPSQSSLNHPNALSRTGIPKKETPEMRKLVEESNTPQQASTGRSNTVTLFGNATPEPVRMPGVQIRGTVLAPNGSAAANAQVGLRIGRRPVVLDRSAAPPSLDTTGTEFQTRTDTNGKFALPMFQDSKEIMVSHDDGFARITLDQLTNSFSVKLKPWSGIQGILRVNGHLGSNEWVALQIPDFLGGFLLENYQDQTYDSGQFSIDHVPPGTYNLTRVIQQSDHQRQLQRLATITLTPGHITRISVGGNGTSVFGKLLFSKPADAKSELEISASLQPFNSSSNRISIGGGFPLVVASDGSFSGADIPPGEYVLNLIASIPLTFPPPQALRGWSFSSAPKRIVVPKPSMSKMGAGVDLGVIQLERNPIPAAAKP